MFDPTGPHIRLRRQGLALRLLRIPLLTTTDRRRAERSRWTWGQRGQDYYVLTPLGILNALTRFYVDVQED